MPLSSPQVELLRRIAINRSPESYVAGATVLHRAADTPRYSEDLDRLHLREPLDLRKLKQRWLTAVDAARTTVTRLPPEEVGCLYLGPGQQPRTPDPTSPDFPRLTRHFGRVRGAWPTISPYQG